MVELSLKSRVRDSGGVKGSASFGLKCELSKLGDLTLKVVIDIKMAEKVHVVKEWT